jgi:iron complex outermembrane receptor protein
LFWANGGNPNLNPETAYQTEAGLNYNFKTFNFSLTGYYNDITDMIRWLPDGFGIWRPQNTLEVETYGIEAMLNYTYKLNDEQELFFDSNYAYTVSENQANGNQLIYVPFHTANANLTYTNSDWDFGFTWLYNGSVFTQTDNNPDRIVDDFNLFDMQISKRFPKLFNSKLSLRALNIFDLAYEAVDNRPMPGRALTIQLLTYF